MLRLAAWIVLILLAAVPARGEDANTLKVGGTAYRLDGIDAPESDQNCLSEGGERRSVSKRWFSVPCMLLKKAPTSLR
jgi:hypothetical protein